MTSCPHAPSRCHTDEGAVDLLLGQAHRIIVRAMRRALGPFCDMAGRKLGFVEFGHDWTRNWLMKLSLPDGCVRAMELFVDFSHVARSPYIRYALQISLPLFEPLKPRRGQPPHPRLFHTTYSFFGFATLPPPSPSSNERRTKGRMEMGWAEPIQDRAIHDLHKNKRAGFLRRVVLLEPAICVQRLA